MIKKIGLPSILRDNDMQYINYVIRSVQKIDPESDIEVINGLGGFTFIVRPTTGSVKQMLVLEIKELHFNLGLQVKFASLNVSDSIKFYLV